MREPPPTFRQQRNEEMRRRFHADIDALLDALAAAKKRFNGDIPPLVLLSLPPSETIDAYRRAELECRERIDEVIRHWLAFGNWPDVAASDEFWLAVRFEHATWLTKCLFCPDHDGVYRYVPVYGGELLRGYRDWLLIHTWAHAGADRFLSDLDA